MRTLVTGATGRIGANVCKRLVEEGDEVRALVYEGDRQEVKIAGLELEIVHGDLRDAEAVSRATDGCERIVHLGYVMGKPAAMPQATEFDVNITGTFNVLEAAAANVDRLERFLFASTNATYDAFHPLYVPMDEDHPQKPRNYYGMEKLLGERMTESYGLQYGLPWSVVRFGTVPGPDEVISKLDAATVGAYLRRFARDPDSQMYSGEDREPWRAVEEAVAAGHRFVVPQAPNGTPWMQDLVDVRDTLAGIMCALAHPNAVGEIFNTTGFGITWEYALEYLAGKTGEEYPTVAVPCLWHWRCDNTKARTRIGYRPEYGIERMIDDALAFEAGKDIGVIPARSDLSGSTW